MMPQTDALTACDSDSPITDAPFLVTASATVTLQITSALKNNDPHNTGVQELLKHTQAWLCIDVYSEETFNVG